MTDLKRIESEFEKHGGVLKTAELNDLGLSSRQIKKLSMMVSFLELKEVFMN